MKINCTELSHQEVNEMIKASLDTNINIINALGHRYIGCGTKDFKIRIENGIPGNALGSYLNGSEIEVLGNASDALGDTMNDGKIVIHGSAGDTVGYAMRGGKIYIRGNAGYRVGIHMKEYLEKKPVIIIGGSVGSFLAEYQAGGLIIVLGLDNQKFDQDRIIGNFPCRGMHGGKLIIRDECIKDDFPQQVIVRDITDEDLSEINSYLKEYAKIFKLDLKEILNHKFKVVEPNTSNPYKKLYVAN